MKNLATFTLGEIGDILRIKQDRDAEYSLNILYGYLRAWQKDCQSYQVQKEAQEIREKKSQAAPRRRPASIDAVEWESCPLVEA